MLLKCPTLLLTASFVLVMLASLIKSNTTDTTPGGNAGSLIDCRTNGPMEHCYTFHDVAMSWSAAESVCVKNDAILATLVTAQVDSLVKSFMIKRGGDMDDDSPGSRAWIGGHESNDNQWKWTNGQNLNAKADAPEFKFAKEPKIYQDCVYMSPGSEAAPVKLYSRHCRINSNFFCSKSTGTLSPVGVANRTSCTIGKHHGLIGTRPGGDDNCYIFYGHDPDNYKQSWLKAKHSCRAIGAELALFSNLTLSEVTDLVNGLVGSTALASFWVGLRRRPWIWVEGFVDIDMEQYRGIQLNTTNWLPDTTPVAEVLNCMAAGAYVGKVYGWTDENCNTSLPFVCEQRKLIPTTTPFYNTTDSYDSSNSTLVDSTASDTDWSNVIIPCVIIGVVLISAIIATLFFFKKRRDGYTPQP